MGQRKRNRMGLGLQREFNLKGLRMGQAIDYAVSMGLRRQAAVFAARAAYGSCETAPPRRQFRLVQGGRVSPRQRLRRMTKSQRKEPLHEATNWLQAKVLDPACGGGAFLSPLARRMAKCLEDYGAATVLRSIQRRLNGHELDPFAAWLRAMATGMNIRCA